MFAGRGIALPPFRVSALVLAGALVIGLGAGWATDAITTAMRAAEAPKTVTSAGLEDEPTATPVIPVMKPITRQLNDADARAGITTVDFPLNGEGTFAVVPGKGAPTVGGGDVRWISVAVEDGVPANAIAFRDFVLETLNDPRGWGEGETFQYVQTDGAADYRVLLASPATAALLCPDPAPVVSTEAAATASAAPSASPSPSASPGAEDLVECDDDGALVVSIYDWIAGYEPFETDYTSSRVYVLMHRLGLLMGKPETECVGERADVMVAQEDALPEACEANPWPFPDAVPADADPSASPSPGASSQAP